MRDRQQLGTYRFVLQWTRARSTSQGRDRRTPQRPKRRDVDTILLAEFDQALLWPLHITFYLVDGGLDRGRAKEAIYFGRGEVGDAYTVNGEVGVNQMTDLCERRQNKTG